MSKPIGYDDLFEGLGPGAQELLDFTKNVRGLNTSYKTFAKNLEGDSSKIAAGLASILSSNQALRTATESVAVGNQQSRAGLDALNASITKLILDQQALKTQQAGLAKVQGDTEKATKGVTSALKQQQDALRKAFAAGDVEGARKAAAAIITLKAETENLTRALRGANSDYTAAAGSYRNLENEARALDARLKSLAGGMDNNSEEAQQLKTQLAAANDKLRLFTQETGRGYLNVGRYAESLREVVASLMQERTELQANATALRTQAQATSLSAAQQERLQQEIRDTDAALVKNNNTLKNYGVQAQAGSGLTAGLSANMGGLAQSLAGSYYGIQGLATALQSGFKLLYDYSDAASDVKKNTGQTKEEFEAFVDVLKTIPTRTPLSGLLEEAKIGGQLGKTKDELEGFVRSIDTIVVALGDDFSGGVEQISNELGTLELIFRKSLGPDQEKNLLAIGNALNQLSADGRATAPFLSDVAARVGNVAANMKLSLPDVLAYAAVLQENGVQAEVAGSSLNRLFSTISNKRGEAFRIAKFADNNLTIKEFNRLINTDFQAATNLFLRGLKAGGTTTTRFNDLLATLKLTSGEAKAAITTLANQTEAFSEKQKTANFQIREGNSVLAESAEKQGNLAASVDKLGNTFKNFFTEGLIGDFFKEEIDGARGQLELLISSFRGVKSAVLEARDAIANSKFGQAIGISTLATPKPERDSGAEAGKRVKNLRAEADEQQKLLDRYEELRRAATGNSADRLEMDKIIGQLQTTIRKSNVALQGENGAIKLNTELVKQSIATKRQKAQDDKDQLENLVSNFDRNILPNIEADVASAQEAVLKARNSLNTLSAQRLALLQEKVGLDTRLTENKQTTGAVGGEQARVNFSTFGFTPEQVAQAKSLADAQKRQLLLENALKQAQKERANAATNLGLINKAAVPITKANTDALDEDIDLTKKKTKSVADLAAIEYQRRKQELEFRADDLKRQSENPANEEPIRLRALQKERDVRVQIAELDKNEGGRLAAQSNKEKIDGEKATYATRKLLSEKYDEDVRRLGVKLSKDEIALHNLTLEALSQTDRVMLEQQIKAEELLRDNVNKTYEERQEAAQTIADYQIKLAELTYKSEVRAAEGALDKIAAAQQKFEVAKVNAAKNVKFFDSGKAIDDIEKDYAAQTLALATARDNQLLTEKEYLRQVQSLEYQREYTIIEALEREYGATEETLRRKAALREKYHAADLEQEQKAYDKRIELLQMGLEFTQQVGSAAFEISANNIDREQQMNEAMYKAETEVAGENEEAKKQADERYFKRRNELALKQFQNDRRAALFQAAISTSLGVLSVLSTGGPARYADAGIGAGILIAGVIAAGLAQSAVILAQKPPIPQYFKGREGGPAEYAMVAERGPELIEGRSGGSRLVTTPQITYLQAGDTVHTAEKTRQLLAYSPALADVSAKSQWEATSTARYTDTLSRQTHQYMSPYAQQAQSREMASLIVNGVVSGTAQVLHDALQQRPQYITEPDGMYLYTRTRNGVTKHLNQRNRRNG